MIRQRIRLACTGAIVAWFMTVGIASAATDAGSVLAELKVQDRAQESALESAQGAADDARATHIAWAVADVLVAHPSGVYMPVLTAALGGVVHSRARSSRIQMNAAVRAADSAVAALSDARRRLSAFQYAVGQERERRKVASAGAHRAASVSPDQPSFGWGGDFSVGVSAGSINGYLASKGSPLAGQGRAFVEAGLRWNIDPRLVVAISGAESAFGTITCAPHNAWGWGCPSSPVSFATWAQAIDAVASGLRTNYLDEGRSSVITIHAKYAPVGADNDPTGMNLVWAINVARFLAEQGGNPGNVQGLAATGAVTGVD